jgi:serine/threonine-protein kinase HipA
MAGRFELTKDRHGIARGRFVYGRSYLARKGAVAIDPFEFKLSDETYETTRRSPNRQHVGMKLGKT